MMGKRSVKKDCCKYVITWVHVLKLGLTWFMFKVFYWIYQWWSNYDLVDAFGFWSLGFITAVTGIACLAFIWSDWEND